MDEYNQQTIADERDDDDDGHCRDEEEENSESKMESNLIQTIYGIEVSCVESTTKRKSFGNLRKLQFLISLISACRLKQF